MSKIPKILPATTTFSFCPDGSQTLQDNADQTFYNSYGTLLTTMHKQCSDFFLDVNAPQSPSPSTHQAAYYRELRGQKYSANVFWYFNHQRILICIFEGITTRIYGITFNLTCSPQYTKWFEQLRRNIPKFDLYLVSSQNSTIFSIQQFNAQPHNPCSF